MFYATILFIAAKSQGASGTRDILVCGKSRKQAELAILAQFRNEVEILRMCPLRDAIQNNEMVYLNCISRDCAFTPI